MKNLIIASTSTIHGSDFLEYLFTPLKLHFKNCNSILFIPYARPSGISHNTYTQKVVEAFKPLNKLVRGIHEFENPIKAINEAEGIFVGGGNTFVLVSQLYKNDLIAPLQNAIAHGTPYLGTSAGSNICGVSMQTTNDMPIVYPPSFKTLGCIPFNINPHYLDPDLNSTHKGETRETRIKEFHSYNSETVIGLREGSWLDVKNQSIILKGRFRARIFEAHLPPFEVEPETELNTLI